MVCVLYFSGDNNDVDEFIVLVVCILYESCCCIKQTGCNHHHRRHRQQTNNTNARAIMSTRSQLTKDLNGKLIFKIKIKPFFFLSILFYFWFLFSSNTLCTPVVMIDIVVFGCHKQCKENNERKQNELNIKIKYKNVSISFTTSDTIMILRLFFSHGWLLFGSQALLCRFSCFCCFFFGRISLKAMK